MQINVEKIYETLLSNHPSSKNQVVVEVGAHRLKQSIFAAKLGFTVKTVDASPQNFAIMEGEYDRLDGDTKKLISLHHNAAGARSNEVVTFSAIGGTGDHVTPPSATLDAGKAKYDKAENSGMVEVKTLALDDLIEKADGNVFLLKIDT